MKIATYNVWNEGSNLSLRKEQLIREIIKTDADLIGLQEVMPEFWDELIKCADYEYHIYCYIPQRGDGLAFLSKYPFTGSFSLHESAEFNNSFALNVTFIEKGFIFSVTNVHLPWDSALAREKHIIGLNEYNKRQKDCVDYFIILGDFNSTSRSSVHDFLTGAQSLSGCEVNPVYQDLADVHAALNGYIAAPTLDFAANPRWKDNTTKYEPIKVDKIMFADNAKRGDYFIRNVNIFGTDTSPETNLAPSDHYGVIAEMEFAE